MKKWLTQIFSILLLVMLVAVAFFYLINNIDTFKSLEIVSPWIIIFLIGLFLVNYVLISYVTKTILKSLSIKIKNGEAFMLSLVTGFYNLITPFRGGLAARALYLKKNHQFSYTDFISSVAASYVIIFLVASLTGILTTMLIYFEKQLFSWIIFAIFIIVFIGMLSIIIFAKKMNESKNFIFNKIVRISNSWYVMRKNPKVIAILSLVSIAQLLITALMIKLQFSVFGFDLSFIEALFISSLGSLSLVISITPAGLGINEVITVFSALTLGIEPTQSLSSAVLGRAIQILVLFILGPLFSFILFRIKTPKKYNP